MGLHVLRLPSLAKTLFIIINELGHIVCNDGLSLVRREQYPDNAALLSIRSIGINFNEILIYIPFRQKNT